MTVGVSKRTRVAPGLLPGLGDDLRASLVRTFDYLIDSRIGFCTQVEDSFVLPVLRNLVIADDPVEAAGRDEHEANTVVEGELQRLRNPILRWFADGVEVEPIAVEGERCLAVLDREADDNGYVVDLTHAFTRRTHRDDGASSRMYRPCDQLAPPDARVDQAA